MADHKEDIIDIDLSVTERKKFRIDGDNTRIVALNTSDMGIIERLSTTFAKLDELANKASAKLSESALNELADDEEQARVQLEQLSSSLKELDSEMRELVDYIFDGPVSQVCAPDGTMYDMFNGQFRFEHIIETLCNLYSDNINKEVEKVKKNINKHTAKYTHRKKR